MTDLRKSWQRMWRGVGARSACASTYEEIVSRYSEPQRKYHSLQHLDECIEWFEAVSGLAAHPAQIEAAIWFHDAVHEVTRSDNEEQSAALARTTLLRSGVSEESATRVENLVLATKHTALPRTPDEQLLADIDLAILGAAEPRFAEYERQIREEYAFVPEVLFRQKRRAILRSFLDRPRIYGTAHFHAVLEERARANLLRVLGDDSR